MESIDNKDREVLQFLHRRSGGDLHDLCDLLGVTRNAVRHRVSRLESLGLLSSEQTLQSRGRPRNTYQVTAVGLHSLGEDYRELAVVFWESIVGLEDSRVRSHLISQVRDRLAERFRSKFSDSQSIGDRVDLLAVGMKARGFNVESDRSSSLPILRETNCPFPMLADVDETICQVEREVLEQVLGAPVTFRKRCRDGHHCCEFEVQAGTVQATDHASFVGNHPR